MITFSVYIFGVIFWQKKLHLSSRRDFFHAEFSDHQFSGPCDCRHFAGAGGIAGVFSNVDIG